MENGVPSTGFKKERPSFIKASVWNTASPTEKDVLAAFTSKKAQLRAVDVESDAATRSVQAAFASLAKDGVLVRVSRGLYGIAK